MNCVSCDEPGTVTTGAFVLCSECAETIAGSTALAPLGPTEDELRHIEEEQA